MNESSNFWFEHEIITFRNAFKNSSQEKNDILFLKGCAVTAKHCVPWQRECRCRVNADSAWVSTEKSMLAVRSSPNRKQSTSTTIQHHQPSPNTTQHYPTRAITTHHHPPTPITTHHRRHHPSVLTTVHHQVSSRITNCIPPLHKWQSPLVHLDSDGY